MTTSDNSCFWLAKILNILETKCPNDFSTNSTNDVHEVLYKDDLFGLHWSGRKYCCHGKGLFLFGWNFKNRLLQNCRSKWLFLYKAYHLILFYWKTLHLLAILVLETTHLNPNSAYKQLNKSWCQIGPEKIK